MTDDELDWELFPETARDVIEDAGIMLEQLEMGSLNVRPEPDRDGLTLIDAVNGLELGFLPFDLLRRNRHSDGLE